MTKSLGSKILLGLTIVFGLGATASAQMTINGAGANNTIIQAGTIGYPSESANGIDRVMEMHGSDTITLNGVTIANGRAVL